jgi:hypothetical protein
MSSEQLDIPDFFLLIIVRIAKEERVALFLGNIFDAAHELRKKWVGDAGN